MKNKVTTYKNTQLALTDEQLALKYSGYLVTINNLASQGKTEYATSLSENDYAIFVPFLKKNGFTVTGNPISQLAGVAGSFGARGAGSNLITISWDQYNACTPNNTSIRLCGHPNHTRTLAGFIGYTVTTQSITVVVQ